MSQRENDLKMINELIGDPFIRGPNHASEMTEVEVEAFASMRFDLTAYHDDFRQEQLTEPQRSWVTSVYERIVPQYANLVSQGLVPKGTPTPESKALDAMLARPKVTRPPPRRKDDE